MKSTKLQDNLAVSLNFVSLTLASLFVLLPIFWFVSTSLKLPANVLAYPPRWLPSPVSLENYRAVLTFSDFPLYFRNSFIVAFCSIIITIIPAATFSYAIVRFRFRHRTILLLGVLLLSMIPGVATLPALYAAAMKTGVHDTMLVLILVYSSWQIPSIVWILKGFFESIPEELEEAGLIDGCSRSGVLFRIVLPLAQPGLAASAIMVFIYVWNEWLIASTLTISKSIRMVPVGLYNYVKDLGVEWGRFTAYTILSVIPVLVIFLLLQTRLIEGLTAGSNKG